MMTTSTKHTTKHTTPRAFTLIEVMVAVAIAGVIAAAATTATMGIYLSLVAKEQQGSADEEARTLLDLVGTGIFQVGGGRIRPWSAVSNGCFTTTSPACDEGGGRQLRYIDTTEDIPQVTLASATNSVASVNIVGGACPLSTWPTTGVDVVLVPTIATGGGWRAARCTAVSTTLTNCSCALSDLTLQGPHGDVPATPSPTLFPPGASTFPTSHFDGGTLAAAQVVTLTHDEATKRLFESRDFRGDGTYASRLVSDAVWRLRVQFGFDGTPEDGQLDQLAAASTDRREWVTSLESRMSPPSCSSAPAACPMPQSALRTVRLGIIVGARAPARTTPSSATLFPESATPVVVTEPDGVLLRATSTVITMRSLLVFN